MTEFQIQISYGENPIESLKPLTIAVMSKYNSKQKKYKIKIKYSFEAGPRGAYWQTAQQHSFARYHQASSHRSS